jgi:hypothetical protein
MAQALSMRPDSPARIISEVMKAGGYLLVMDNGLFGMPARLVSPFATRITAHRDEIAKMLTALAIERL